MDIAEVLFGECFRRLVDNGPGEIRWSGNEGIIRRLRGLGAILEWRLPTGILAGPA
jgi:hypothetical protein